MHAFSLGDLAIKVNVAIAETKNDNPRVVVFESK